MVDLTYTEIEKYILGIPKFSSKNTPEDSSLFMKWLKYPGMGRKIIHVAGTNGKGSVCAYLRSILMEAGFRTGMFTSPHLVVMRERICLDKNMISEADFSRIFEKVQGKLQEYQKTYPEKESYHPSFFEFLFIMSMLYFEEKQVDYIILETGMGGRLDATNVVPCPKVCVITDIGYDHMQYLGDTLQAIAGEKAGIIKSGVPVVYLDQKREVGEVIRRQALIKKSEQIPVKGTDIFYKNFTNKTIDFSFHSRYYDYISLTLSTRAIYQMENAMLAVHAIEAIQEKCILKEHIRRGLKNTFWPGRMEEIAPGVLLDGAHNEDGIRVFLETAAQDQCSGKRLLLFGVVDDKRYDSMVSLLMESRLFNQVSVTTLRTARGVRLEELKKLFSRYPGIPCTYEEDAAVALQHLKVQKSEEDIIYIAGSLYLAGEIEAVGGSND